MRERFSCSRWIALTLPAAALDVDARLRRDFRHLLERRARLGELLLVRADLLLAVSLSLRFELLQLVDRRVLARDELVLLLGVQRLLFRGDGEVAARNARSSAPARSRWLRRSRSSCSAVRARSSARMRASSAARSSSSSVCSSAAMPLARVSSRAEKRFEIGELRA